jgi:hypothetical protein
MTDIPDEAVQAGLAVLVKQWSSPHGMSESQIEDAERDVRDVLEAAFKPLAAYVKGQIADAIELKAKGEHSGYENGLLVAAEVTREWSP